MVVRDTSPQLVERALRASVGECALQVVAKHLQAVATRLRHRPSQALALFLKYAIVFAP